MKDQVKSALRYPSFVVASMVIAVVIVNIFVIPAFAKVFKGFGAELPLMTRSQATNSLLPIVGSTASGDRPPTPRRRSNHATTASRRAGVPTVVG